jgi:hypothetical protein
MYNPFGISITPGFPALDIPNLSFYEKFKATGIVCCKKRCHGLCVGGRGHVCRSIYPFAPCCIKRQKETQPNVSYNFFRFDIRDPNDVIYYTKGTKGLVRFNDNRFYSLVVDPEKLRNYNCRGFLFSYCYDMFQHNKDVQSNVAYEKQQFLYGIFNHNKFYINIRDLVEIIIEYLI